MLPFFIDRLRGSLGVTRVAKLVGSDRVDMVHVGPSPGAGAQLPAIRSAAVSCSRFALTVRDEDAGSHTVFELPDWFLRIAPRARGLRGPLISRFDGPLRLSWIRRRF